jgi:DNA-binding transcriptional ArsR family regulator
VKGSPNIARIGALIGDTTRAVRLTALMVGRALTAGEIAREAGVTSQTASSHLAKLELGGLLRLRKQGRHRYFALASEEVASLPEHLMGLVADTRAPRALTGPRDAALRKARFEDLRWMKREQGTRVLRITRKGVALFNATFSIAAADDTGKRGIAL